MQEVLFCRVTGGKNTLSFPPLFAGEQESPFVPLYQGDGSCLAPLIKGVGGLRNYRKLFIHCKNTVRQCIAELKIELGVAH